MVARRVALFQHFGDIGELAILGFQDDGVGGKGFGREFGQGHDLAQLRRVKLAWATGPLSRPITSRPSSQSRIRAKTGSSASK